MTENFNEEGRPQNVNPEDQTRVNPPVVNQPATEANPAVGSQGYASQGYGSQAIGSQSQFDAAQAAAQAAHAAAEAAQAAAQAVGSAPYQYGSAPVGSAVGGSQFQPQVGSAGAAAGAPVGAEAVGRRGRSDHAKGGRHGGSLLSRFGRLPSASGMGAMQDPTAKPKPPVPPKVKQRRMVVIALVMPLFMMIVMPLVMTGMFTGSGEPHHMDVAVIGTSQSVKDQVADMDKDAINKFDVKRVDNVGDAKTQIREHDIRAAYNPKNGNLYYAGANGTRVTQALTAYFTDVAKSDNHSLHTQDVVKTTSDDKSGSTVLFLGLGALLGGFMSGMMLSILPVPTTLRVALGIGIPAVVSTVEIIYGWAIFGIFDGNAVLPWCIMFLLSISCLTFTMGGILNIGPAWMPVAMVACSLLGMSTSGIMAPLDIISPFYGGVHPWLFSSQGFSALRDSIYFKDAGFAQPVLVMLAWIVGGILLAVLGTVRQKKKHFDAELNKVEEAETGMALAATL